MPSPRNVLIVQPYGIGDLLFLTPVFRALRLVPGIEKVDLLLGSRTEAIVRHNPHIDQIYTVDKDLFHRRSRAENLSSLWELARNLRAKKYDLMLDYSFRDEYAFFGKFFLNIPRRAGYARRRRGLFHNIRLPIPQGFYGKHVVEFAAELAERAGISVEDRYLEFYLSDETRQKAKEKLESLDISSASKLLLVSPGGGESWGEDAHFKQWPARHFSQLVQDLARISLFDHVLILGSEKEKAIGDAMSAGLDLSVRNLMGKLSIEEAGAVLERATLFVGNDGGLVHLARAMRVPLIAFYGPVDPKVYGPYPESPNALPIFDEALECRPCYKNFRYQSDCQTRACLQDLRPAAVLEKIFQSALKQKLNLIPLSSHS